uniref:Uncharacterized protein n=1 Tax=Rhizophagus irregularis (strain DAOM 181602 / DAOM 197198 / MUCL 43194) TaxID=747089 RepID=U9TBY0_RHIID
MTIIKNMPYLTIIIFGPTFGCSELDLFGDHGSCTNLNWAYEKQIGEASY